ncbi:MAG: AarF/ABC1/UbiB kinase family protein [Caldilinea sp. CFX5]|nr:AarF/ABC1/UbiB kinase family protein [Caldilinea sp. CFX5]
MNLFGHASLFWSKRHRRRSREIAEILTRHGLGALVAQLGLVRYLDLPRRLLHRAENRTHSSPGRHLRLAFEELGPTFIKLGQLLSTRPDLLPPETIAELKLLQDRVPPAPWDAVQPWLEAELGRPLEACFAAIETTPLAAASLAQVYGATLADGRQIVVKVQRPQIEPLIETDLEILLALARRAQQRNPLGELYDLVAMAEEFAVTIRSELDYRREAHNAELFQANFADAAYVHIPKIYWEYTTRRVLTMERLDGIKIDDIAALTRAGYDCKQVARAATRFVFKEILEDGVFHADPHPGNYVVLPGTVVGVMDFGKVGYVDTRDRVALTLLFIALIQMDAPAIVDQMIRLRFVERTVEREALEADLRRVLKQFQGVPLHEIRITALLNALLALVFRHRLRLPTDFILLLQTLSMMEAAAIKLDPDFEIFAVAKPYVRRFQRQLWLRPQWGPEALRSTVALSDLLLRLPQRAVRILDRLEEDNLGLQVRVPQLPTILHKVDRVANQFTITLLTAAFIVAVAWLLPLLDLTWPWNFATWLVVGAFAIVNLSGLWLLARIMRSD